MNLLREYIKGLLTEADIHGARVDMYFGTGGDSDLYDELMTLRFPLTVYRGLRLKPDEETDFHRLGKGGEGDHWSRSRRAAIDFAKGSSPSARKFGAPILVTGQIVSPDDVDWQSTVDLNREHPNEAEIVAHKVSNSQIHSTGEEIRYHEVREYIRGLLIEQGEKKPNWEIQKSPIHGVGVFAVSDIPANTNLGAAQIKKVDGRYDVTDLGRHHNHSYDPTCYNKMKGNIRYLHPYNNMRSGDEITIDYTLQLDLEQPGPKWK